MSLRRKLKNLIAPRHSLDRPTDSSLVPEASCEGPRPQTIDGPALTPPNPKAFAALVEGGKNYGIKTLYDYGKEAYVDIVFVHGLTGNAYNTWLDKETGVHWPSKLLRLDIPESRILSFGYDADVVNIWARGPASSSRLSNHAENLVGRLVREREQSDTVSRKIIFVAHSLGGLVIEQALTHSKNSAENHLNQIECCTIGIVFLGVPHCGSDFEAWATFGRRMVSIFAPANKDIVNVLNPDSEMLHMIENNFHTIVRQRRDDPIELTCFYEELAVKGIGEIVPQRSAKIPGYNLYGIHANHMDMTKFPSREDPGYDAILGELQRWAKMVHGTEQDTVHSGREGKFSTEGYACLQSLWPGGIDYESQKNQNPKRVSDTCLWTLQNPRYLEWRDNEEQILLWISADPGCGKSVLARCIVDEDLPRVFANDSSKRVLYYFFKDTSLEQRSISRAMSTILHQLFMFRPQLIRHALPKYKEKGAALSTIFPELWSIFTAAATDPTAGNIICVLDALDECNDQEQPRLLECLEDFCLGSRTSSSASRLKFLITSRPSFEIRRRFDRLLEASNNIELAGNDESASIKKEIDLVIRHQVANLKRELRLAPKVSEHLEKRLLETEHRTYLWLHLLWNIVRKNLSGTNFEMDRLVDNLPDDIKGSYEVLLQKCPDSVFARKVLQLVLVAARPLTLTEIDVALNVNEQTSSYATLEQEGPSRLQETLPSRCGLMISIIHSKVYFIHQTVKEFLLGKLSTERPAGRVWQQSLELAESHHLLSKICLRSISFSEVELHRVSLGNALLPKDNREMEPSTYCRSQPFLSYSAVHWADHFRDQGSNKGIQNIEYVLEKGNYHQVIGRWGAKYGTLLQAASSGGHNFIVQMLLEKGADVNAQGGLYGNALQAASYKGHDQLVQMLLEKGADVNAQGGRYGNALQAASCEGHNQVVQMLLEKGADVNAQGGLHGNALQAASYKAYTCHGKRAAGYEAHDVGTALRT
ncbi:hypothetical protein N7G274_001513 [Stereocaulon virgatum]|uniref:DUF676 domain-containing protein n=1 Tax=Stereocaulon virgatum TaxID=373712 RepID=A0ABR4AMM4_9LECA